MEKFLPGRHLIESFGNGGFRLGGVSHVGSVLIAPSGVRALLAANVAELLPEQFDVLATEKDEIDMLLIGTGSQMLPLSKRLALHLKSIGLNVETMSTNAAVRTYNVTMLEDRRVAAVIIAVDKAYG